MRLHHVQIAMPAGTTAACSTQYRHASGPARTQEMLVSRYPIGDNRVEHVMRGCAPETRLCRLDTRLCTRYQVANLVSGTQPCLAPPAQYDGPVTTGDGPGLRNSLVDVKGLEPLASRV